MKALVIICLIGVVSAGVWRWDSCSSTNAVTINRLTVTPDPITMPGEVMLDLDLTLNRDITDARLTIKAVQLGWIVDLTLPCVENIGSCSYPQLCNILPRMEAGNWAGIGTTLAQGIRDGAKKYFSDIPTCGNSLKAQRLQIKEVIKVEKLPSILSFISEGEYDLHISVDDNKTNQNIACIDLKVELEDTSSIWGRRRRRSLH